MVLVLKIGNKIKYTSQFVFSLNWIEMLNFNLCDYAFFLMLSDIFNF